MKLNTRKILLSLIFVFGITSTINAQQFQSEYFIDGATYSHHLNPAFMPERGYFSIMIGNINTEYQSNIGLSKLLFPIDDSSDDSELVFFLNDAIDADKFLDGLNKNNCFELNINPTLFSLGFYAFDGFNTIEYSIRSNTSLNIPYEAFEIAKKSMESITIGSNLSISNLKFESINYSEIALGHSHQINDKLQVGGKFKILFGSFYINCGINQFDFEVSAPNLLWKTDANMKLGISSTLENFEITSNNELITSIKELISQPSFSGKNLGGAIDLGATYQLTHELLLSASVLDLGAISWNSTELTINTNTFSYNYIDNLNTPIDYNDENYIYEIISEQSDKISDAYFDNIADEYKVNSITQNIIWLSPSINFGANYTIPSYNKLKVGALSSTKFGKITSWTEVRIASTLSPVEWFDVSLNYGISKFGSSMGGMINIQPRGINFFIGSDNFLFSKLSKNHYYLPNGKNSKSSLFLGINFTGKAWSK